MKQIRLVVLVSLVVASASLIVAQNAAAKHTQDTRNTPHSAAKTSPDPDVVPSAKIVHYGNKDVIRLRARIRYTTLIILPAKEQILDYTCGDKEYWIVNGTQNLAYVKPARIGAQTNLNLITASGNIYSFVLVEVSESSDSTPDLKVFVEPRDESMISAADSAPRFVSTQALDDYRQQATMAKEETRQVRQATQEAIDTGINRFVSNMRFPYRFEAGKKPFFVRAMYEDGKFTYIQARPEEAPALYEVQDGKPNLVNFEYRNGVYVVEKVLTRGYLVIGKQKLSFTRED